MITTRTSFARPTAVLVFVLCSLESTATDLRCQTKVMNMVENRCAGGGYRGRRDIPRVLPKVEPNAEENSDWRYHNLVRKQLEPAGEEARASVAAPMGITGVMSSSHRRSYESPIVRRSARSAYENPATGSFTSVYRDDLLFDLSKDEVDRFYYEAGVRISRSSGRNPSDTKNALVAAALKCCRDNTNCDDVQAMIPCP